MAVCVGQEVPTLWVCMCVWAWYTNRWWCCVHSVSDVHLEPRADSRSTLSVDSSVGPTSMARTLTWTPPLSVEGSTPTWTEGTPSFTESSSSGDLGMLGIAALSLPHYYPVSILSLSLSPALLPSFSVVLFVTNCI